MNLCVSFTSILQTGEDAGKLCILVTKGLMTVERRSNASKTEQEKKPADCSKHHEVTCMVCKIVEVEEALYIHLCTYLKRNLVQGQRSGASSLPGILRNPRLVGLRIGGSGSSKGS